MSVITFISNIALLDVGYTRFSENEYPLYVCGNALDKDLLQF